MKNETKSENPNREVVLASLLATVTIKDAAKKAKVSVRTVQRFLEDESFKAEYRAARRAVYESAIGQVQSVIGESIQTLRDALTSENDNSKIRAAQILLDFSTKAFETTDILERLEGLEAMQNGLSKGAAK